MKQNKTKRNETKRNKTKPFKTKRTETKQNKTKEYVQYNEYKSVGQIMKEYNLFIL